MCLEKWAEEEGSFLKEMKIDEKFKRYARGGSTGALLVAMKDTLDSLVRDLQNDIFKGMQKQNVVTTENLIQETYGIGSTMESLRKINSYFGTDYETDPFKIEEHYGKPLLDEYGG